VLSICLRRPFRLDHTVSGEEEAALTKLTYLPDQN
jgi:hypothetical protein